MNEYSLAKVQFFILCQLSLEAGSCLGMRQSRAGIVPTTFYDCTEKNLKVFLCGYTQHRAGTDKCMIYC